MSDTEEMEPTSSSGPKKIFSGFIIALAGITFVPSMAALRTQISQFGGTISSNVTEKTTHVIYGDDSQAAKIVGAKKYHIPVVRQQWVTDSVDAKVALSERKYMLKSIMGEVPGPAPTTAAAKPASGKKPAAKAAAKGKKRKHDEDDEDGDEDDGDDGEGEPMATTSTHTGGGAGAKPFAGMIFCITGAFRTGTRKQITDILEKNGAEVASTVNKRVTHLLACAEEAGTSKYAMALGRGIPIVDEDWYLKTLEEGVAGDVETGAIVAGGPSAKKKAKVEVSTKTKVPTGGAGASSGGVKTIKLIKKGKAAVDPDTRMAETTHVYEEGADVYSSMLNQTDISNNHNKFYHLQLLEADTKNQWWTWNKWGRVGLKGQNALKSFTSLEAAKKDFKAKYRDKSANNWEDRHAFVERHGKYKPVEIDEGDDAEEAAPAAAEEEEEITAEAPAESTLDKRVQVLVNLLCDIKKMEANVVEMKYDIKQMPLGKMTKAQIAKGVAVLKQIETHLRAGLRTEGTYRKLSDDYYTLVPHVFGMQRPPTINSFDLLNKEIALMEALGDIEVAKRTLSGKTAGATAVDSNYERLKCNITAVDKESDEYRIIEMYVKNTHGKTHNKYTLEVVDAFTLDRPGEKERYEPFRSMHNRMLLWHGSRLSNYVGILSQGLRIAPPEAPVTGYMFGKGVYFADMCSKSANYCWATAEQNIGCLILGEAALGDPHRLRAAEFIDHLPPGTHSVMGEGGATPNPKMNYTMDDGVVVPLGKPVDSTLDGPTDLLYNEFVVYDEAQCMMRYMVMIKFHYIG